MRFLILSLATMAISSAADTSAPNRISRRMLPAASPIDRAIATSDAGTLTAADLYPEIQAAITAAKTAISTAQTAIVGAVPSGGWNPSQNSVQIVISDPANAFPAVPSTWGYVANGAATGKVLAAAGWSLGGSGGRFAAFGANPIAVGIDAGFRNLIASITAWLLGADPTSFSPLRVTIAHIPGSGTYNQDTTTHAGVASLFPAASVNAINACDNAALAACLANSDILIIGRQIGQVDDSSNPTATTNIDGVRKDVEAFLKAGKPVIYAHYGSTTNAPLTKALFPLFGLGDPIGNGQSLGTRNTDAAGLLAALTSIPTVLDSQLALLATLKGDTPLLSADISSCKNSVDSWASCNSAAFKSKLSTGAISIRDQLRGIDGAGLDIFPTYNMRLLKLWILLGDIIRKTIVYPITYNDLTQYSAAVFGDSSILYRRPKGAAQTDGGTAYCPRETLLSGQCMSKKYDYRSYISSVKTNDRFDIVRTVFAEESERSWGTTGLFALPGKTITVRRTDNVTTVNAYVYIWYQKETSTKAMRGDDTARRFKYDKPQFLRSHPILIRPGTSVKITAPLGGPLYVGMTNVGSVDGQVPRPSITLSFDTVALHAASRDLSREDDVKKLGDWLVTNPLPVVDMRLEGFELHARKDRVVASLKDRYGGGSTGARLFVSDYVSNFVYRIYYLAGLQLPGKTFTESFSIPVARACAAFGWNCMDAAQSRLTGTQHLFFDEDTSCGSEVCRGNPLEFSTVLVPTGWTMAEEMGRQFQSPLLGIYSVKNPIDKKKELWKSYSNRGDLNSIQIFPYYIKWAFERLVKQNTRLVTDSHANGKLVFSIIQSAAAEFRKMVEGKFMKVTVTPSCQIVKAYDVGTEPSFRMFDTIYSDTDAPSNKQLLRFSSVYAQLPLVVNNVQLARVATKTLLPGFDIFPLLNQHVRLFNNASKSQAAWMAQRDILGFSLYPYSGDASYEGETVSKIPGNDFLLISLSFITGLDFRGFLFDRGIPYSKLARSQVLEHIRTRAVVKDVNREFFVLDDDLPQANLSTVTVPLNGKASWPRNGWSPIKCYPAPPSPPPAPRPPPSPPMPPAPPGSSIEGALFNADASLVSGNQLRAALLDQFASIDENKGNVQSVVLGFEGAPVPGLVTVPTFSYDVSHDSYLPLIGDLGNAYPALVANWKYNGNTALDVASAKVLAVAGDALAGDGGRFIVFGGTPFTTTSGNPGLQIYLENVVRGLLYPKVPSDPFRVVVSQLPGQSSYWFNHDLPTINWFTSTFPSASVASANSCDGPDLPACLVDADLLVIGNAVGNTNDVDILAPYPTVDADQVASAVKAFSLAGKPVIHVNHLRDPNDLAAALFGLFGVSGADSNLGDHLGVKDSDAASMASLFDSFPSPLKSQRALLITLMGETPLDYDADLASCAFDEDGGGPGAPSTWRNCKTAGFLSKLGDGSLSIKGQLEGLDSKGKSVFDLAGWTTLKLWVLLSDKYRSAENDPGTAMIRYPVPITDLNLLASLVFADSSVHYRRASAPAQKELGTAYCPGDVFDEGNCASDGWDYRTYIDTVPVYTGVSISVPVLITDTWTSTGLFALPGKTITVRRTDSVSTVTAKVVFWFQREATTKALQNLGDTWSYKRPQFMRSTEVLIKLGGDDVKLTAPYGGPIYISMTNTGSISEAADPRPALTFEFDNVAKHPALLDMTDDDLLDGFIAAIAVNKLPAFDFKTDIAEVHGRIDKLLNALEGRYGGGEVGLNLLVDDYRTNFITNVYQLAGFKVPGQTLAESHSPTVLAVCSSLGWDCTNQVIHRKTNIQHINYDEAAVCGSGCSGNPFDQDWTLNPIGWGESHELGHNLQINSINLRWLDDKSRRNEWDAYIQRATENSNNIFPYHTRWHFERFVLGNTDQVLDYHMNQRDAFAILQSAIAGTTRTISSQARKVALKTDCSVKKDFPTSTPAGDVAADTIYFDGLYAADNGLRMSFYFQFFFILSGYTIPGVATFTNSFDIWTLFYLQSRLLYDAAKDDTTWTSKRDSLGFSLFPRTGHATYGSGDIRSIPGNDFLLISLSYITRMDFRPYWNIRGVRFTDLANSQIEAHISSGRVTSTVSTAFYATADEYPNATISGVPTVPLDGTSSWPGLYGPWSPQTCA